jgi:hypothetical protein
MWVWQTAERGSFSGDPKDQPGAIMIRPITDTLRLTKPAEEPLEALLFATPEGNLVADDPHQQKLDLKVAPGAADLDVDHLKKTA